MTGNIYRSYDNQYDAYPGYLPPQVPLPSSQELSGGGTANINWLTIVFVFFAALTGVVVGVVVTYNSFAGPATGSNLVIDRPSSVFDEPSGALTTADVLARTAPAVVVISAPEQKSVRGGGAGSGVIISEDGLLLTNAHVIGGNSVVQIIDVEGASYTAELVGSYPEEDVALLQIVDTPTVFTPATLGNSTGARVGDDVVAIGNALGLGDTPTVTKGIISGLDRNLNDGAGISLTGLIQTDTAINPGNSGGPLVNAFGEVIGINTAIIDGASNVGFAIPIDSIKVLIDNIREGGGDVRFDQAFLGIASINLDAVDPDTLKENAVDARNGAYIIDVTTGSPAQRADIRVGDVITSVDGKPVTTSEQVVETIRSKVVGDNIEVTVERKGQTFDVQAELRPRSESGT